MIRTSSSLCTLNSLGRICPKEGAHLLLLLQLTPGAPPSFCSCDSCATPAFSFRSASSACCQVRRATGTGSARAEGVVAGARYVQVQGTRGNRPFNSNHAPARGIHSVKHAFRCGCTAMQARSLHAATKFRMRAWMACLTTFILQD